MDPILNRFRDNYLLTYSLDTNYCIPFRTLSITHSSVFLVKSQHFSDFYTALSIPEPVHF